MTATQTRPASSLFSRDFLLMDRLNKMLPSGRNNQPAHSLNTDGVSGIIVVSLWPNMSYHLEYRPCEQGLVVTVQFSKLDIVLTHLGLSPYWEGTQIPLLVDYVLPFDDGDEYWDFLKHILRQIRHLTMSAPALFR